MSGGKAVAWAVLAAKDSEAAQAVARAAVARAAVEVAASATRWRRAKLFDGEGDAEQEVSPVVARLRRAHFHPERAAIVVANPHGTRLLQAVEHLRVLGLSQPVPRRVELNIVCVSFVVTATSGNSPRRCHRSTSLALPAQLRGHVDGGESVGVHTRLVATQQLIVGVDSISSCSTDLRPGYRRGRTR